MDANINRLREGLRVLEDTFRFINNDQKITLSLKDARHTLKKLIDQLPEGEKALLKARDSINDVGAQLNTDSEMSRQKFVEIIAANFKRTQESARVLEEYTKLFSITMAAEIKSIRYLLYNLEKELSSIDFEESELK